MSPFLFIMSSFNCRQCGACCRQPGFVYLKAAEPQKIAQYLGVDLYELTDRYCDVMDRRHLVLKKHADETCVFLRGNRCLIYEARPEQCRDFPLKWATPRSGEYCEGLKGI